MPLTRDFKDTVKARAERDPKFRAALLKEALDAFLAGETEVGKILLRDCVNATVGFERLGEAVDKDPKSLMRMLSKAGNPTAENLFKIVDHLQSRDGIALKVVSSKRQLSGKTR